VPIEVYLSNEEIGSASIWQEEINKIGFIYELKGSYAVISEIPSEISVASAADTFVELVSKLVKGEAEAKKQRAELFEKALYQASCKAAIKAGRVYDLEHIKWIVDRVLTLDNIKYCPHGRPVAFEITKHFLEKQFERIK
jgi:DNA mismatch repair protein MutL